MSNPEYVKVDNKMYKINTDFRIALECNRITGDESISDFERALAIIYKLFGEKGFECKNQDKLLELAHKYLTLGESEKEPKNDFHKENKLDFLKCQNLISSSFKYDYGYDPYKLEYLHWYEFYNDLKNLSNSEFGNCCILNRIQNIINYDVSKMKDGKEKKDMIDLKKSLIKDYCIQEKIKMTKEQEESANEFYKSIMERG